MTQEVATQPQQAKKKIKRDRVKIKAKCPKCRARMFRDDNNMAYCKKDGVQEIGASDVEKGTISTVAKNSGKIKEKK